MVEATVATQFETVAAAAEGCDVIVGATALQIAGRSVAEMLGIPYVFAAYCPTVLPSPHHAPPPLPPLVENQARHHAARVATEADLRVRLVDEDVTTLSGQRCTALPLQRPGFVSFAWFADTASYERHRQGLEADPFWRETVAPGLAQFAISMSTTSRLVPVGRSREFRDWVERPQ